jgi:hypothetical protein
MVMVIAVVRDKPLCSFIVSTYYGDADGDYDNRRNQQTHLTLDSDSSSYMALWRLVVSPLPGVRDS